METCEKCGVEQERQTKRDLTKGLVWLDDGQCWICPRCLKVLIKGVTVGVASK